MRFPLMYIVVVVGYLRELVRIVGIRGDYSCICKIAIQKNSMMYTWNVCRKSR